MSIQRQKGISALSTVLQHLKNCEMFEKYIYDYATKKTESEHKGPQSEESTPERDSTPESGSTPERADLYNWYIYQVVGLLLQDAQNLKKIYKTVKEGKVGWNSPTYDDVTAKFKEHDEYLVKPFEVVEGVAQCGKCGSKKTWSVARQLRSGDEAMSTISRCVECGNSWVYSG
jgi:DNA-directed RNA polymerase subunit M/transcription elongation factor TFIIS